MYITEQKRFAFYATFASNEKPAKVGARFSQFLMNMTFAGEYRHKVVVLGLNNYRIEVLADHYSDLVDVKNGFRFFLEKIGGVLLED